MEKKAAKERKIIVREAEPEPKKGGLDFDVRREELMRMPRRFAGMNRLILRDLNQATSSQTFYLYTKEQVQTFLKNPDTNEKNIRNAVIYMYGASSHFRRLIQYFASLTDLAYVVTPYKIDPSTANPNTIRRNYNRVLNTLASMDIRNEFAKIVTVCLREDVFYGTMWVTSDSIIIQQLPSDYCKIAVIEDNVPNVSFDFSYFDSRQQYLEVYPQEFKKKYTAYQNDRTGMKWQELDSPTSFAVKCNSDIMTYALPPFAGLLREIYDIEDYKQLKITKTELENYAMLVMKLGINEEGEWEMDLDKA